MSDAAAGWLFFAGILATVAALIWAYRSSLRESSPPDANELVSIATGGETEVGIMVSRLEGVGMKAVARNRYVSPYPNPMYGWELLVRYADHEEARRILDLD